MFITSRHTLVAGVALVVLAGLAWQRFGAAAEAAPSAAAKQRSTPASQNF